MHYEIGIAAVGDWDPKALADAAECAETSGWDGIFLEDYIIHWAADDIPTYDPWISMAAAKRPAVAYVGI